MNLEEHVSKDAFRLDSMGFRWCGVNIKSTSATSEDSHLHFGFAYGGYKLSKMVAHICLCFCLLISKMCHLPSQDNMKEQFNTLHMIPDRELY